MLCSNIKSISNKTLLNNQGHITMSPNSLKPQPDGLASSSGKLNSHSDLHWVEKRTRQVSSQVNASGKKTHFKANISCISLANNRLMDVTQFCVDLGWVVKRWKTFVNLLANSILTKVSASHRKSTQVRARPGQMESQVDPGFQLVSTCDSVWPGLKK